MSHPAPSCQKPDRQGGLVTIPALPDGRASNKLTARRISRGARFAPIFGARKSQKTASERCQKPDRQGGLVTIPALPDGRAADKLTARRISRGARFPPIFGARKSQKDRVRKVSEARPSGRARNDSGPP